MQLYKPYLLLLHKLVLLTNAHVLDMS